MFNFAPLAETAKLEIGPLIFLTNEYCCDTDDFIQNLGVMNRSSKTVDMWNVDCNILRSFQLIDEAFPCSVCYTA